MQSDQPFCPQQALFPFANQVGINYLHNAPPASAFSVVLPPSAKLSRPFHGVEFQPTEDCPKNFIIFDQTDDRNQIMFHPAIGHKLSCPGLNIHAACIQNNFERNNANIEEREVSSPLKEDSDDIDALLSLEEEEEEEEEEYDDDEEISTARTHGDYGRRSPDSYSTGSSKPRKNRLPSSVLKSSGNGSSSSWNSERKRQKMKKMVKTLRGIVPGGNSMNSVAVLDEAVRYLKSLKVEVQKLGVGNLQYQA